MFLPDDARPGITTYYLSTLDRFHLHFLGSAYDNPTANDCDEGLPSYWRHHHASGLISGSISINLSIATNASFERRAIESS